MSNGFIYVLLNPAFPSMVKIGRTKKSSEARAGNISKATGVPLQFIVLFDVLVNDIEGAEKEIHARFSDYRVNKKREFFYISSKQAISALIDIAEKYPIAPVPSTAIDDALPFFNSRFHDLLDPNIFSIRMITIPGSCYLKIGRRLNGIEEYSEEELPLGGLKTPETVTPEVVEHNAKLLATLDEYDWIMVSSIFPREVAQQIAEQWEGAEGKVGK